MVIFLVWTGSRTGIIATLVGVLLFFRAKLGRFLGVGILVGIFVLLSMQIYTESTAGFTDLFARGDTRSHVWGLLIQGFLDNPMWGSMTEQFGAAESSYLSVAGSLGLYGVIPLATFMAITARQLYKLERARKYLGDEIMLANLVTAGIISLAVGAIFEGYLLGLLAFPVFVLYIYLALLRFLLDAAQVAREEAIAHATLPSSEEYDEQPALVTS
jgi:hypothetical protein